MTSVTKYFNLTDVVYLREKWRIIGGLIGALPSHPRQNAQLGLPLKLMPEETTLLLEMGIYYSHAVLLSEGNSYVVLTV